MAGRRTTGSVRKRSSGRWQARVTDPATGRLVGLGTFSTKAEADRALAAAMTDQGRGGWVDPGRGKVRLSEYAWDWLDQRPLRPRTKELYDGLLRLHIEPDLGAAELGRLTPSMIRRWHSRLLTSGHPGPSTVAKAYRLLHTILATAAADELIARNPCTLDGAGRERAPERPVITVAQVWELAETVAPRYRLLVVLAAFTGLRRGELFGLRRPNVDLLHRTMTVKEQRQQLKDGRVVAGPPKTVAGQRTIVLPEPLIPELETHLASFAQPQPDGLLFVGERGGPLRDHVWQHDWARAQSKLGLADLHFHDLRHVANTLAAASGASTRELMHRMGHASSDAALRYQHATRDRDAAIAQALGSLIAQPRAKIIPIARASD